LNRIRGGFERLGWEHLGNTAYRYPELRPHPSPEDWFNHVVPALMLLRAYARYAVSTGRSLTKFTIDVQSSTGFNPELGVGTPPLPAARISYSLPSRAGRDFGRQTLMDWIDGVAWPYAPSPPASGSPGA
jgi:hypothetical protein